MTARKAIRPAQRSGPARRRRRRWRWMRRRASEPPAGRDDQSKVSPPLREAAGPGRCARRVDGTGRRDTSPLRRSSRIARPDRGRSVRPPPYGHARAAVRRPPRGRPVRLRRRRAARGGARRVARRGAGARAARVRRPGRRARVPRRRGAPSARRVRRPARRRGADPRGRRARRADHRPRRLRRRRRVLDRGARPGAAHARRRRRLVPAEPDRRRLRARARDRRAARRARHASCWSPSTARSRRSTRWRPRAPPGSTSSSPTTTRRAPTACCPTRRSSIPRVGGYPCPELCAAGVAHLLARALLEAAGMDAAAADADLDLVALATVADCVPLVDENRRLVREGLRALASTRKPGLQALMQVARVDPSGVDAGAIGFRLAPRINAAGRLHRADAGLELLLTSDVERARAIAEELDRGQRRAARRRDADPLRGRGAGRRGARRRGRAGGVRARRRRLAPGRDRDRRLADRRAPPPARGADRARRRRGHRLGPVDPRVRPARRARGLRAASCCATAATAPPRG